MKWIRVLIVSLLVFLGVGFYIYHFVYNKAHPDYQQLQADVEISAVDMFNDFKTDAQKSALQYNGKMILVSGVLTRVEKADSTSIAYFVLDEGMFGDEGVRINLLSDQAGKLSDQIGSTVKIKAFCSGFNDTDVILEHGSIQK